MSERAGAKVKFSSDPIVTRSLLTMLFASGGNISVQGESQSELWKETSSNDTTLKNKFKKVHA